MKTTFRYLLAAVVLSAAAACTKSEDVPAVRTYEYALDVIQEPCSRTSMDGKAVLWSQEDKIGVTGMDALGASLNAYKSAGEPDGFAGFAIDNAESYVPSAQASFTLTLVEGVTPVAVAYPYFQGIEWKEADDMTQCKVRVPDKQKGIKGNIPQGALAMVGAVEGNSAQLYTVGSVIRFEITRDDITSLEFKGNNEEYVSKESWYDINTGALIGKTSSATKTVTLTPSEGDVFEPGEYYFVVAPVKLSKGFTITLTNAAEETASRSTSDPFTLVRNTKYTGFGSDEGWFAEDSEDENVITQSLLFADEDGASTNWPFIQELPKYNDYSASAVFGPFNTETYPDLKYSCYVQALSSSSSWQVTAKNGLRFGKTQGDYLKIHAVEGYKLTKIEVRGGTLTWKCTIMDTEGNTVGAQRGVAKTEVDGVKQVVPNTVVKWELSGTTANTDYIMHLDNTDTATFRELTLTYELVK